MNELSKVKLDQSHSVPALNDWASRQLSNTRAQLKNSEAQVEINKNLVLRKSKEIGELLIRNEEMRKEVERVKNEMKRAENEANKIEEKYKEEWKRMENVTKIQFDEKKMDNLV